MDWRNIVVAALIGGTAGGIGGLIGTIFEKILRNSNSKRHRFIVSVFALAGFSMANNFGITKVVKHVIFPNSIIEDQALDENRPLLTLLTNDRFKLETKGMSSREIDAYVQKTVHDGLKRMSDQDLVDWNRLRLDMAYLDFAYCAGLWRGDYTGDVNALMSKLPSDERKRFIKMILSAALLELDRRNNIIPNQKGFDSGLMEIGSHLQAQDSQRLKFALSKGVNLNSEDACFAMKTLMKGASQLPDNLRIDFLRSMAAL